VSQNEDTPEVRITVAQRRESELVEIPVEIGDQVVDVLFV
jgi:hypothetical protein